MFSLNEGSPAYWKMEYVMETRLKKLIEGSESRTNKVSEKKWRKSRREAKKRETRMKDDIVQHYKSLHDELDRRQKWIDNKIETMRPAETRKRIATLEGIVSELRSRVDRLEMKLRLEKRYPEKKSRMYLISSRDKFMYNYGDKDDYDNEEEGVERSILMEQAEEYRKRDRLRKKKKDLGRRRKRVVEEGVSEDDVDDEKEDEEEKNEKEDSPIRKRVPKAVPLVQTPYINIQHRGEDDLSIMSSFNRTRRSLEESHGRCTAALRNAGILLT